MSQSAAQSRISIRGRRRRRTSSGSPRLMETYMAFWRRGWWAWWLMLLANLCLGAVIMPLAYLFRDQPSMYYLCSALAWLIVGARLWGMAVRIPPAGRKVL